MTNFPDKDVLAQNVSASANASKHLCKFLACFIGTAAVCLSAYTLTVHSLVQNSEVPATYKWFLLKEVPGPRIIFESGSNSHHAIDTDAVGAALGMTAINIADNGGYALEDKITRLETYARPGDVIVLPLEWTFYHREKLTDNYVETLFTDNRDYYRSMPIIKRVKRALSLPPEKVITELTQKDLRPIKDIESPAQDLFVSALTQTTGHQSREKSSGPGLGVAEQSCDDYILGSSAQRRNLKIGENLKPALRRLEKLKNRGIDIHFAWPVLVGKGCLNDSAYVKDFRQDIEEVVNKAGFEFLGTPGQSLYGQDLQDDSPYHIIAKGTEIHTQKMIGHLKSQGYGELGQPLDIKTFARHRLLELELAQAAPLKQPALPFGEVIALDDKNFRPHIDFTAGWWAFEAYGRWMRDNRAMFRVTLPKDLDQNSILEIKGVTKSGRLERADVTVNGEVITTGMFGENSPLQIPMLGLPQGEALSIFISLPEASVPQSPLELEENEDARTMTLHFQTLQLIGQDIAATEDVVEPPLKKSIVGQQASHTFATSQFETVTSSSPLMDCAPVDTLPTLNSTFIKYSQGWWAQEATGRWMKGSQADLILNLPSASKHSENNSFNLRLEGDFFLDKPKAVKFLIDGQETGPVTIAENGIISTSFYIETGRREARVSLKLIGASLKSPRQLGLSQDERTLTYFLKSAAITAT